MTIEDASQQAVSGSILRHVLLGFHPASLEERFQQEQVKRTKTTDLLANTVFALICSLLAWNLLHYPNFPLEVGPAQHAKKLLLQSLQSLCSNKCVISVQMFLEGVSGFGYWLCSRCYCSACGW